MYTLAYPPLGLDRKKKKSNVPYSFRIKEPSRGIESKHSTFLDMDGLSFYTNYITLCIYAYNSDISLDNG